MISRLTGILAAKRAPQVLIDCNGVGYEVDVSLTTFYQLPEVGVQISIWTHLLIKDDAHSLIGFNTEQERKLFRQLIRVNGVGPKLALTILSGIEGEQFAICVTNSDIAMLTRLPGVGKKTAERLILELRDKMPELAANEDRTTGASADPARMLADDLVSALLNLGFARQQSESDVEAVVASDPDAKFEDALKNVLRKLST